jgi:hypothetical protein
MNGGIINSNTRLHLVGYFYRVISGYQISNLRFKTKFRRIAGLKFIWLLKNCRKTENKTLKTKCKKQLMGISTGRKNRTQDE